MKRCCVLWVLPLLLVLGACATGVQVSDAELVSRQIHTAQKVDEALSTFLAGLDKCGPSTSAGLFTEVHHGVAECSPPDAGGVVICDVYVGMQIVGPVRRSDVMLGRLFFRPVAAGADISIGIQPWAGGRELVVGAWEKLVQGRAQEVCPKKFGG
jgi:hypothetical protein